MKKIFYLLVFFSVSTITHAQSRDEKQVATAVKELNKALLHADKKVLENITVSELSYGHSSGKIENKTQFVEAIVKGIVKFSDIDISDQTITIAGNNAIVRHRFSAKLINNGTPLEIKIGALMVWVKQKGKWKLLARQGYKL